MLEKKLSDMHVEFRKIQNEKEILEGKISKLEVWFCIWYIHILALIYRMSFTGRPSLSPHQPLHHLQNHFSSVWSIHLRRRPRDPSPCQKTCRLSLSMVRQSETFLVEFRIMIGNVSWKPIVLIEELIDKIKDD